MNKKISLVGLGLAIALLSLAVFAACKEPEDDGPSYQIQITDSPAIIGITGIPLTVLGQTSYKIYVQLSAGMDASAGYIAKGDALIGGKPSVTVGLKTPDGDPCLVTGLINMAVVISPQNVTTWSDANPQIEVYANQKKLSTNPQNFTWGTAGGFLHLNEVMLEQVHQIFDGGDGAGGTVGIVWDDPGITKN